jgi:glycine betaine/proline transport system permease protein/glycine betaine/proline transport system substrate-binding protein
MSEMVKKFWASRVMCLALGLLLALSYGPAEAASRKRLVMSDNQWDSQTIHTYIVKYIIENGFDGYQIEVVAGAFTLNWQSVIRGDIDLDIESWTNHTATYPDDLARGDIIPLGITFYGATEGIYVPRYMIEGDPERGIEATTPDLKHIKDLVNYTHIFKDPETPSRARLYGAVPQWDIDAIMYKKYLHYGLDKAGYNYFRLGSEPMLFLALMNAYSEGQPWAGYIWEPTWITNKLDIVRLEDAPYDPALFQDGLCASPIINPANICHKSFPEKAPDLIDFLTKFRTSVAMISDAMAYIEDTKASHANTAIWFLKKYDSHIDDWLTPEQAKKVRDALAKN